MDWHQMSMIQNALRMQAAQQRDYRNPANMARLQAQSAHMDVAQKYLFAMANHMPPTALGLTPGQIYASEQGLTGYHMNPQTGAITKANAYGGSDPVDPKSLLSTINTNLGGNLGSDADSQWRAGTAGDYSLTPGQSQWGLGQPTYRTGGNNNSNIGGGAGNPNNTAGPGGLAGSAGNALRQMFMDSGQFNPNGANTYAIQNMNLSGDGGLGSNMGGMPSNGLFNGAVPTAQGTGNTSGQPMPTTPGSSGPLPPVTPPPAYNPNGGGLGGGQHNVRQGGGTGGANGTFTGTIDQNGATQYQPPPQTLGGASTTGTGIVDPNATNPNLNQTRVNRTTTPSYFGGVVGGGNGARAVRQ